MGELVDLNEFRERKLSSQFDAEKKKRADDKKKRQQKQNHRERKENEIDESMMRHPAYQSRKKKFEDDQTVKMPTYQYKCSNDHFYEEDRSIHSEEPIITCDQCHEDMKKVFGSPSINLVGRGFYRNGG